jgi:hypothetical protein
VDAETGRITGGASPAYRIVLSSTPLIDGVPFPATDVFGNPYILPYNAGADQTKDTKEIIADQPDVYQSGLESNIGEQIIGSSPLRISNIGFSLPAGLAFTGNSYSLKENSFFSLSDDVIGNGDNGPDTRLQLTLNFTPIAEQEYTDTLTISAAGAYDFVIPLRGVGIAWTAAPLVLQDFSRLFVGNISEAQTVTIT